jgi:hypothetical protein
MKLARAILIASVTALPLWMASCDDGGTLCHAQSAAREVSTEQLQARYEALQEEYQRTNDSARTEVLNREVEALAQELTRRNEADLRANTKAFGALMIQMQDTLKAYRPSRWQRFKRKIQTWWGKEPDVAEPLETAGGTRL